MASKRQRRKQKQRRRLVESAPALTRSHIREEAVGGLSEVGKDQALIEMITPGWGSSGYYSQEVLERDMPRIYPAGSHMYVDHPTESELWDRPERSVKELAAVTLESARWDPQRNAVVAKAQLFPDHSEALKAKAAAIGVSIFADGEIEESEREVDGQRGPVIHSLTEGFSADFVTRPGRGGRIGELLESARQQLREAQPPNLRMATSDTVCCAACAHFAGGECNLYNTPVRPNQVSDSFEARSASSTSSTQESRSGGPTKEGHMDEETRQRLSELEDQTRQHEQRVAEVEAERDSEKDRANRAEDRNRLNEAEKIVVEALQPVKDGEENPILSKLPERAIERVKEAALRGELPTTEDGKLDKDKLSERAEKLAKDEWEYLSPDESSRSTVVGMGSRSRLEESGGGAGSGASEEEVAETFQELGLSESGAKLAARGR